MSCTLWNAIISLYITLPTFGPKDHAFYRSWLVLHVKQVEKSSLTCSLHVADKVWVSAFDR